MSQLIELARAVEELTAAIRAMANPQTAEQPVGACVSTHAYSSGPWEAVAHCIYLHGHNGAHGNGNGRTWTDPAPLAAPRTHNSSIWEDEDGWHVSCEHHDCPGREDVGSEYDAEEWAEHHRAEATAEDTAWAHRCRCGHAPDRHTDGTCEECAEHGLRALCCHQPGADAPLAAVNASPQTEQRCCVCGTTEHGGRAFYENVNGQLFCWPCADDDRLCDCHQPPVRKSQHVPAPVRVPSPKPDPAQDSTYIGCPECLHPVHTSISCAENASILRSAYETD